jgi:sodium/bile acid cotransporter 7
VVSFVAKYKKWFKQAQMYTLVFIVYTVFCKTFQNETVSSIGEIFIMIAFQLIMLLIVMALAWYLMKLFFPNEPKLRVMGLFGCTHKTVAMGVPLIGAIYENDTNVGVYTLPLLIWHPMQLVIGSALAPRLSAFVDRENERLGIVDDDGDGGGNELPVTNTDDVQQQEQTNDAASAGAEQEQESEQDGRDNDAEPGDEEAP